MIKRRIRMFRDEKMPDELIEQTFGLKDKSNWKLRNAREGLRKAENWEDAITQILYRPFDIQWIFYHEAVIERSRREVMRHMLAGDNLALITSRLTKGEIFKHAQVTCNIVEVICMSPKTSNNGFVFPLYLYPDTDKKDLFSHKKAEKKEANLNAELVEALSEAYKKGLSPEEIFYYTYAVLYSNTYRTKYAEFLRIDFPRIPFTKGYKLFSKLAEYGKRLVDLHLLKSTELDPPIAKFQGKGESKVEKVKYDERENRVYFNQSQYFEGIRKEIWQYQIGGYQVCDKWLKDRKERRLSLDDVKHYCKIATSLQKTIEIQKAIDEIYTEVEKGTVEFERQEKVM